MLGLGKRWWGRCRWSLWWRLRSQEMRLGESPLAFLPQFLMVSLSSL